jgi:hypothetical protein
MTTFALKLILNREISRINRKIDRKIALGKSYKKEASLHRELLKKLHKVDTQKILALL